MFLNEEKRPPGRIREGHGDRGRRLHRRPRSSTSSRTPATRSRSLDALLARPGGRGRAADLEGRRPDPRRRPRPRRAGKALEGQTPSSTSRRSSAIRRARATPSSPRPSTSRAAARWSRDARALAWSARLRLDLLQLRPDGRSDRADRRERRRSRPSRSTPSRRSRSSRRCSSGAPATIAVTCLRFATVYGVAPRMRFDLTVNEFTRDLWAGRKLEVFGEQFWRPYVHVRDAARAVALVLDAPRRTVAGEVFNVGHSRRELPQARPRRADPPAARARRRSHYVHRDEDPRDYKVSFGRIGDELGFEPLDARPRRHRRDRRRARRGALRRPVRRPLLEHG